MAKFVVEVVDERGKTLTTMQPLEGRVFTVQSSVVGTTKLGRWPWSRRKQEARVTVVMGGRRPFAVGDLSLRFTEVPE